MGPHKGTLLFAASIGTAIVVACGSNGGNGASTFPGDGGKDGTSSGSGSGGSSGGCLTGNCDASGSSSGTSSGGGPDATVDADFGCDGCAPFPPSDAGRARPRRSALPTLVYPPDGVLLPPNMNVLEVQWLPPRGRDALRGRLQQRRHRREGRDAVQPGAPTRARRRRDVRAAASRCRSSAWNDIANTNRDGDPVKVTVRATPAERCVTASPQSVSISFAKDDLTGGIYYWQSATYGGSPARRAASTTTTSARSTRRRRPSGPPERIRRPASAATRCPRTACGCRSCTTTPTPTTSTATCKPQSWTSRRGP